MRAASQASACLCVQMLRATGSKPERLMETKSETKSCGCQIPLVSDRERERDRNKGKQKQFSV